MRQSLSIGKLIYSKLHEINQLGTHIYPLIAEQGTTTPYAIYSRTGITPSNNKDGNYQDTVYYEVKVVANTYYSSVALAEKVREKLTMRGYTFEDMTVWSNLTSATEDWQDNEYVQTLQFELEIN